MIIEVCANSFQSACNAQIARADRVELCSELSIGGITPSYGLLKKITSKLDIPVHVLIRPRSGDFCYSSSEFEIMKENILLCKSLDCSGIVSGILLKDMTVDEQRTKQLIDLAYPLPFTFHRAFDWVSDPIHASRKLSVLGVKRILTSGQEKTAIKGLSLLKKLNDLFKGIIIPAGGISLENCTLFKDAGFTDIHLSASEHNKTINKPKIPLNSIKHFEETKQSVSSLIILKKIISKLHV